MQAEDQEALFKQYGESFQTVTDLQRQIAEDEYLSYAASLASLMGQSLEINGKTFTLDNVAAVGSTTSVAPSIKTVDTTANSSTSTNTSTNNSTNTSIGTIIINTNDPSAFFQKMASDYGVNLNTK